MKILKLHEVEQKIGMKKSWIYREANTGRFPKQVRIGRSAGWVESEIDGWLMEKIAERDGAAVA